MAALIDRGKFHRIAAVSSITFFGRLGGIAGLLGVALGLALGLDLLNPAPSTARILQALSNAAVIVWLVGVAATQSPRLGHARVGGRLGSWGWARRWRACRPSSSLTSSVALPRPTLKAG